MSKSVEAQIAKLRPVPRLPDVKIENMTILQLELALKRENSILGNRLLVARLDDQGAKLRLKATQIETELTRRQANPSNTPETITKVHKNKALLPEKEQNTNNHDAVDATKMAECEEQGNRDRKLRGRYDECLVPAVNLYSRLKSMSLEDSIVHIQKEGQKHISRTNEGRIFDVSKKQSRLFFTKSS